MIRVVGGDEMTKTNVCVLLACLLMAGSAVASPTVSVKRIDGYYAGDGGEFTLTPNAELAALLGSSAKFESFCLEKNERVASGTTYRVVVNDEALLGGGNDGDVGDEGGDPLCDMTAYLYTEFRAGTLTGYDYTVGAGREASAQALQNVIWYLEDEIDTWTWADGSLEDIFRDAAEQAIASGEWEGVGHVCVLNLYDRSTGEYKQDMLGLCAVPAPGAIVLGALGSCVVGFLRRRHML
jgi:hypothetical protein